MAYPTNAKIQQEVEQEADEYLEEVASGLRGKGVRVDTKVLLGTPASAIADYSHEVDCDIIAMADARAVRHLALGSGQRDGDAGADVGEPGAGGAAGGVGGCRLSRAGGLRLD